MKSITKCPHCETQFYVDDAQLSQYNGKVRCGNCLEVFVAADYFIDKQLNEAEKVVEPTPEVVEEINADDLPEDVNAVEEQLVAEEVLVEDTIANAAEGFEFKQADTEAESEANQKQEVEEEFDGLTSAREVDENFIAKTESLIKNINIEDAAAKLEPVSSSRLDKEDSVAASIDNKPVEIEKPVRRKSFLDDDPEEVVIQQPGFSFKIDSPDTLDVLSKWREESANQPDTQPEPIESKASTTKEKTAKQGPSIAEPPTPMTDEFVLPEADQKIHDPQAKSDETVSENYDFLLTEKEPLSPWMIALAVLLILLLLGQGIYYFRNQLARSVPELKPLLQQFCAPIGCKISLPEEINLLSIDDSGIQQDAKLEGVIRLSSTITNRAKFSQAYPKLEVTLTDERDMPKVRRVFAPTDYLKKQVNLAEGIQAGESIPVEMALMTDAENISGFRILLAY